MLEEDRAPARSGRTQRVVGAGLAGRVFREGRDAINIYVNGGEAFQGCRDRYFRDIISERDLSRELTLQDCIGPRSRASITNFYFIHY